MNRGIIIAGVVIVLVGGGLFVANQQSQNPDEAKIAHEKAAMEEKKSTENVDPFATKTQEQISMEKQKSMMEKSANARYLPYSRVVFDQEVENRRVLFFYASWCPTCRPTDANLKENENKIPEDATVIRVNYNDPETDEEEKDLAQKYGITYQHTFVQIDSQGNKITAWNGGQIDELVNNIK